MKHHLQFGTRKVEFTLEYHSRKSLGIKVHPDATIQVLAPVNSNEHDVLKKLKTKAPWILKQVDYFNSFRPTTPARRYLNGETHLYLGRQYRLKIIKDTENTIKAYRGQLWIHSTDISVEVLEKQLQKWYKQRAEIIFEELLEEVLPKFQKYKISRPVLTIRWMKKRWGSCTPGGKIILNPEIIKASKGCIEYVIIHELCHLVHHSHTKPFFELQNRILPESVKWKNRLENMLA